VAGFTFCAGHVKTPTRDKGAWSYPLVFGLLLALPPEDASGLERALDEANRRWEARANPFTEDLEDGDPNVALARWLETAPASAGTAMAAAQTRYCATDKWCVTVVARESACPEGFLRLADDAPEVGRARFLAWPFGYALWLRADDPAAGREAARALRGRIGPGSPIGLVLQLHDDEETKQGAPVLRERLRRHEFLRRAASLRGNAEATDTGAFRSASEGDAAESPTPEGAFPARLGELDVVVLPKLEVTRDPAALERTVLVAAPRLRVVSRRAR
jgi:hypothetical protein